MNNLVIQLTKKKGYDQYVAPRENEKKNSSKTGVLAYNLWFQCGALSMEEQTKDGPFWGSGHARRSSAILNVSIAGNIRENFIDR